jgi:nickel superoxide dismutase
MIKRSASILMMAVLAVFALSTAAQAHCEIPCGIYDDSMRIDMLREHVTTMEKAMKRIKKLNPQKAQENNQLVRWISNKEEHAEKFQEIVNQYFLTQRIHLNADKYTKKVTLLHHMLVYAMRCKQTVDMDNIEKLRSLIDSFEEVYFEDDE